MIKKIPNKNISLMLLNDDEIISLRDGVRETKNQDIDESIKVGDICVEQKPPIDGETLPKRYYKILGIIHKLHDIDINSFFKSSKSSKNFNDFLTDLRAPVPSSSNLSNCILMPCQ